MRTIVDLPKTQIEALDKLRAKTNLARTELIRRAVDEYLQKQRSSGQEHPGFGIWREQPRGGLEYQRSIRREWET